MHIEPTELKKASARYAGSKRVYGDNDPKTVALLKEFQRVRALLNWSAMQTDLSALNDSDVQHIVTDLENRGGQS